MAQPYSEWSKGVVEYWSIGVLGKTPLLHHSNTPVLHFFGDPMKIEVLPDADAVAQKGAEIIAAEARAAVKARGHFIVAVSGGHTPWQMLRAFSGEDVPWQHLNVVQVDERVAPEGHADRNLTHLYESLLESAPVKREQIYPMPVELPDLKSAAETYAETLKKIAGSPPVLDLVHLGLGPDGHTASLVPGDPVLNVIDSDVAVTGLYQDRRRMTLTYPILNRARSVLWIVTGKDKVGALKHLREGDPTIPAGRIQRESTIVLADKAAAGQL
jgi:6-phosphogluconolactonase